MSDQQLKNEIHAIALLPVRTVSSANPNWQDLGNRVLCYPVDVMNDTTDLPARVRRRTVAPVAIACSVVLAVLLSLIRDVILG